ncbi:MAG: J domain-containing protein [Steroidobacteraceae bacterium]
MPSPRFKATLAQTLGQLESCFKRWRVGKWDYRHTTSNVPGQTMATVEFEKDGSRFRVSCSKYATVRENMRAIYLRVEAARLDEARGAATAQESLHEYLQLTDGTPTKAGVLVNDDRSDPWAVLGLMRGGVAADIVRAVYQARIRQAHPDAGGTDEAAARINDAYRQVMAELGERP